MKVKTFIIIGILTIVTFPSITAQFEILELNTKDENNKANVGYFFTHVFFAYGKITNLKEFGHGYCLFYVFKAVDVICILFKEGKNRPFIHRFTDGEWLGLAYPRGILKEHFVFAFG